MNKVRFDGSWANRPRDAANLARFATKELERPLNFQVVSIERPWTDWTDCPILYLASHQSVNLTDGQVDNIRQFIDAGGLLFTQADGNSPKFDAFAHALAKKLYPQYPMQPVPNSHLIYSMLYKVEPPPPLMMVSNGSRALMVHSAKDLSMAWQQRMDKSRPAAFQLGVNLFLYAAGKTDLKNRTASNVLAEAPTSPAGGKVKVARLRYDGSWDPEPFAWTRFGRWFYQETGCGVEVSPVDLDALKPGAVDIAHLTGTAGFTSTAAQAKAVRDYVDGGGTLLVDCTGGDATFSDAAALLVAKAFPDTSLQRLPANHPLFAASSPGMDVIEYPPPLRSYALTKLGKGIGFIDGLSHGKGHIIFSAFDATSGLLATHTWGILGYPTGFSQSLFKNVLLWTAAGSPDK